MTPIAPHLRGHAQLLLAEDPGQREQGLELAATNYGPEVAELLRVFIAGARTWEDAAHVSPDPDDFSAVRLFVATTYRTWLRRAIHRRVWRSLRVDERREIPANTDLLIDVFAYEKHPAPESGVSLTIVTWWRDLHLTPEVQRYLAGLGFSAVTVLVRPCPGDIVPFQPLNRSYLVADLPPLDEGNGR